MGVNWEREGGGQGRGKREKSRTCTQAEAVDGRRGEMRLTRPGVEGTGATEHFLNWLQVTQLIRERDGGDLKARLASGLRR